MNRLRSLSARQATLIALALLTSGWIFWTFFSTQSLAAYPRTNYWIDAANCARQTGRYLVVCEAGGIEKPVEDVSLADDRGHTLLLSVVAVVFKTEPTLELLRRLNIAINLIGFLILSTLLIRTVGWRSGVFTAVLGAYWIGGRSGPDVDASYIGIAAMSAASLVLAARPLSFLSVSAIALLIAFTALIRQPIGLGAALSLILVATASMVLTRNTAGMTRSAIGRMALLFLIAFAAIKAPLAPTAIRNSVLGTAPTGVSAHGLSHNLFLGLGGFVDNKWGIVWDDSYAQKIMKQLQPDIEYCSDEYFSAIGNLYWKYVSEDPLEAARVYVVKTLRTISAAEGFSLSALFSFLMFGGLCIYAKRKSSIPTSERLVLLSGPALLGLSFIAQGILTHPAWTYIYPGPVLLLICVAAFAESVLAKRNVVETPSLQRAQVQI